MTNTDALLGRIDRGLDAARERLFAWLRIPSISAEPAHSGDCRRAAGWVCDELAGLYAEADVIQYRQYGAIDIERMAYGFDIKGRSRSDWRCTFSDCERYHFTTPFCHISRRSRVRNSNLIAPEHNSDMTISAAYMFE